MPEVNAVVTKSDRLTKAQNDAHNMDWTFIASNWLLNQDPKYRVFLYNISELDHVVSRPPTISRLLIPGIHSQVYEGVPQKKTVSAPALNFDKPARTETTEFYGETSGIRWALSTTFPSPVLISRGNVDSGALEYDPIDGRVFAMDIVNPDNRGLDQDAHIVEDLALGMNIGKRGVFWSTSNPPTENELRRARARMETHYRSLIEKANTVQASKPSELPDVITPEFHAAADYFGEEYVWHAKRVQREACPNCGEKISHGAKFHRTQDGIICVLDWAGAVRAGAVKRADAYEVTGDEQFAPRAPQGPKVQGPAPTSPSSLPTEKA